MTDEKKELADLIYREISELPCSNSGVIAPSPQTLRNNLSTRLIEQIAAKAAEVAMRRLSPAPQAGQVTEFRRQAWRAALCTHAELASRGDAFARAFWDNELADFDAMFPRAALSLGKGA